METKLLAIALLCDTRSPVPLMLLLLNYLPNRSVDSSGQAPSFNMTVCHAQHIGTTGCCDAISNASYFTTW